MVSDRSNGSYWRHIAAFVGITLCAIMLAWCLYPEKPRFSGNTANEAVTAYERAGGSDCQPSVINRLPNGKATSHRDACERAKREQTNSRNSYIQARRSADAADASAIAAFDQARVAAIGASLSFITLIAACFAGYWAMKAAHHTETSAIEAAKSARTAEKALNSLEGAIIQPHSMAFRYDNAGGSICFCFRNFGRSSAIVNKVSVSVFVTTANNPNQIQNQTNRPIMFEERIAEGDKSEILIIEHDIFRQFGGNIDNAISDLHIMISFDWKNQLGGLRGETTRFIWSPKRKKFLRGIQLWDEIERFGGNTKT